MPYFGVDTERYGGWSSEEKEEELEALLKPSSRLAVLYRASFCGFGRKRPRENLSRMSATKGFNKAELENAELPLDPKPR